MLKKKLEKFDNQNVQEVHISYESAKKLKEA